MANQHCQTRSHATQDKTRERVELERDLSTQRARLAETEATAHETEQARAAYPGRNPTAAQ